MRARNVNFRETHSERSATRSYKGYQRSRKSVGFLKRRGQP